MELLPYIWAAEIKMTNGWQYKKLNYRQFLYDCQEKIQMHSRTYQEGTSIQENVYFQNK